MASIPLPSSVPLEEEEEEKENVNEFMTMFVKAMDTKQMGLIDSLMLMKLKDPRFPLHINQCILLAAKEGSATVLSKILALGSRLCYTLSYTDAIGRRAIHYAAENGHLECVRLLLKAGSISNCSDMFGNTPLHLACSNGHVEIVSFLVQQCAHINSCRIETGHNALHITAATSHIDIMNILLDNGGDINMVTKYNKGEETPIHKAVHSDKPEMVEYLCQRGANPNICDANGNYPIHIACVKGLLQCISILVRFEASLDVVDRHAQTPLLACIVENKTEAAKLLVELGANIHAADKYGYTPLHTASMKGNLELIDYFLAAGADINVRAKTTMQTPIMSAVNLGKLDAIHALISMGADVTLPNDKGHTPLHFVHMKLGGAPVDEITRALLEGGACLDARDCDNLTPLQRGIKVSVIRQARMFPWLQLMCQAGSVLGPDVFTQEKHSPMFWLAYSGLHKEAVYLIRAGWNLSEEGWAVLPGRDKHQNKLHKFIISTFQTLPSLMSSCRKVIRSHLSVARQHREILSSVDLLPLPDPLKSYLKLFDIDPEDVSVLDPAI